jgi:hypothetical protein
MARASRGSSANLAVGTTLYVRHLPHLINIWLSTTRRSAVDHRDQPASATMPHAPQTRSSLSLPIGNSKGWRALKSTIDAAGWGMPIVRSLVCVRVTAECFRPERRILMGVLDRRQAVDPVPCTVTPVFESGAFQRSSAIWSQVQRCTPSDELPSSRAR